MLPLLYTPGKALDARLIGGWMGFEAGLDAVAKRNNPCPWRESKPCRPARYL